MQWGIDHEEVAVVGFEALYGKTRKCGMFIHRGFYFFGASPDRIWKNSLLEIKCSHVLRHTTQSQMPKAWTLYCQHKGIVIS